MNIALVNPASPFLLDDRVFPSLGILKVGAHLIQNGHNVDLIDLAGQKDLKALYRCRRADVIGITATTPQMPEVMRIMNFIRETTDKEVILGGPHVTLVNAAVKKEKEFGRAHEAALFLENHFDKLVAGDGLDAILVAISGGQKWIDADDRSSDLWMDSENYSASSLPGRELIDLKSYKYHIDGTPATSLIAQLGCPFSCGFCGGRNSPSLRFIRTRPVQDIIDEIELIYKEYGFMGFMFYDDELNVSPAFMELLQAIKKLKKKLKADLRFRGFIKAELLKKEHAEAMYDAGFRWVLCGFEGAHERILTNIRKRATLEDNERVIEYSRSAGLKVKALMSIGHPGESNETIMAIKDWLLNQKVDDFDCTVITPYPGTPYYDESEWDGEKWVYTQPDTGDKLYSRPIDYHVESNFYKGIPGEYKSMVWTDYLTGQDLARKRDILESTVREYLDLPYPEMKSIEQSMGQTP